MVYQTKQAKQERQHIIHVARRHIFRFFGDIGLVADQMLVYCVETRNPIAMLYFAVSLNVVLATTEIPHKVAHIHMAHLIREEIAQILTERWHIVSLSLTVVADFTGIYAILYACPRLVCPNMMSFAAVHTRE